MKKYIRQVKKGLAAFLAVVIVMGAYVPVAASVPPPAPIPAPAPVPTPAPAPAAPTTQLVQPLGERNHTTRGLSYENEPYLVITKQTNLVTAISSDGLIIFHRNYFEDIYDLSRDSFVIGLVTGAEMRGLHEWVTPNAWVSSDPSVFEVTTVSVQGIISLDFPERAAPIVVGGTIHGLGTTTITRTVTPANPHTAAATIGSFTLTVAPYERTLAKASPGMVQIIGNRPVFLTQENIADLLEFAPQRAVSNITLPDRRLTDEERNEWIADYRANGGPTRTELEVVMLINEIRAEHNLHLVSINNRLMAAARFYTQQTNNLRGLYTWGHNFGPYAINPNASHGASANVVQAFGSHLGLWGGGNGHGSGSTSAEGLVNGWMNSPGHRRYILSPEHRNIGIGQFPGGSSYLFFN